MFLHYPILYNLMLDTIYLATNVNVHECTGLDIIGNTLNQVKSDTDYKGYRFSIGNAHAPGGKFFAYGALVSFQVKGNPCGTNMKQMLVEEFEGI